MAVLSPVVPEIPQICVSGANDGAQHWYGMDQHIQLHLGHTETKPL